MPAAKTFSDRVVERYDSAPLIEVVVDIIAASQAIPLLNARVIFSLSMALIMALPMKPILYS